MGDRSEKSGNVCDTPAYWAAKRIVREDILKGKDPFASDPKRPSRALERYIEGKPHCATPLKDAACVAAAALERRKGRGKFSASSARGREKTQGSSGAGPGASACDDRAWAGNDAGSPYAGETLDAFASARQEWHAKLCEAVRAACTVRGMPLSQPRTDDDEDLSRITHLYDASELLRRVVSITSPNHAAAASRLPSFSLIAPELPVPSMDDLRAQFAELAPGRTQCGLDDELWEEFAESHLRDGLRLVRTGSSVACEVYARRGVPRSLRARLYPRVLGVNVNERERALFDLLYRDVEDWEFVTDELVRKDVTDCAMGEDFFLFEEVIEDVLLVFSRDPWVGSRVNVLPHDPVLARVPADAGAGTVGPADPPGTVRFPTSGILPYRGMVLFVSPLCYLYEEAEDVYYVFRELYARHFCKLHAITAEQGSLVHLCKLFEILVQARDPDLFYHLVKTGVDPLRVAFPWISRAFAGYLPVAEVLVLWDRIIGYDTLILVPVLAAALFAFRADELARANNAEEVRFAFEDPSALKVVPLLQFYLFHDEGAASH